MADENMDSLFGSDDDSDMLDHQCTERAVASSQFIPFSVTKAMPDMGGGRGLFATTDLKPGSLILAEKPFISWNKHSDFGEVDDLATAILQILQSPDAVACTKQLYPYTIADCEASECDEICKLFESFDTNDLKKLAVAGGSSTEEIIRIALVLQHNGFGSGLYERQSLLNHSCAPNCLKLVPASKNGCSEIWTICDVKEGDELTICYVNPLETSTTAVRKYLSENHRFVCHCTRCQSLGFILPAQPSEPVQAGSVTVYKLSDTARVLLAAEDAVEQRLAATESSLANHDSIMRHKSALEVYKDLIASVENLQSPFLEVRPAERPDRLLARASKAGINATVGAIEVLERAGKPVRDTFAVSFLEFQLSLLSHQTAYLSLDHADIGTTLDSVADAILSLKQQFPRVFAEQYASRDWSSVVRHIAAANIMRGTAVTAHSSSTSCAAENGSTAVSSAQCANLCKTEAKRIKALYSTALHFPAALKLFTSPPGSFYWGGVDNAKVC